MIFDVFKKRTKTSHHSSKKNLFIGFLEEFEDNKNHFEFNWPLTWVLGKFLGKKANGLQIVYRWHENRKTYAA